MRPAGLLRAIRARSGEVLCSASVRTNAGGRWSASSNGSGAGSRRAFNPEILIVSEARLTFSLSMQLEFHQLDRRWEHLRVRHPARQRRLLASLAESGQQTPIVVVAAEGQADRYVVIDGYKRIAALEQLGRDTVEAVVWPMSEAAAVLLDRSLRLVRTRDRAGGGLAAGGVGAALRLRPG